MDHIRLARWADVALLCPATANSLNRLAAGLADDAIGALFLAWGIDSKPYLIAPAMNATMWDHPATRASRERLAGFGARILPVGDGRLACGEQGEGRLLEVDELEKHVMQALEAKAMKAKVVVTSGATREADRQRALHLERQRRSDRGHDLRGAGRARLPGDAGRRHGFRAGGRRRAPRGLHRPRLARHAPLRRLARDTACAAVIHTARSATSIAEPQPDAKIASAAGCRSSCESRPTRSSTASWVTPAIPR
jgi:hypothetical protein